MLHLHHVDQPHREPKFGVGQFFRTRGKHPRLCHVTAVLRTYNQCGELVKIRYEARHEFAGQSVTDYDVSETTIAIGAC